MGFVIVMIKSPKTLRMTMLRRWGCGGPGLRGGGASNKYTLCTVSQLDLRKSCFHKVLRVQNACNFASFRNYALAEILRSGKFSQL